MSHAVVWSENSGPIHAGSLDFGARSLRLSGTAPHERRSQRQILYSELVGSHLERRLGARLGKRPTLVLEDRNGGRLRLGVIDGSFFEVADRVEALIHAAM